MRQKRDLTGQKFGTLTVIVDTGRKQFAHVIWLCQCNICGKLREFARPEIIRGVKTCTCEANERNIHRVHLRLYRIWKGIKGRCCGANTDMPYYKKYGARGIRICDEWRNSFWAFYDWANANGYEDKEGAEKAEQLSIDRINPDGNYEPENCRWVTLRENSSTARSKGAGGVYVAV